MLKSIELKQQIGTLKAEILALKNAKQQIPAEKEAELDELMAQYQAALASEQSIKGGNNMEPKVTKKEFSAALRKFIAHKDATELKALYGRIYNEAIGQNGAVTADGGALVPEEMLDIVESNKYGVDLRPYVTAVSVGTRSGKIPAIDYSQDLALTDFDENNAITETKAVYTQLTFSLASKGAIIPVSNELLLDANADVLAIISTLFNRIYIRDVNKDITAKAIAAGESIAVTGLLGVDGIDAIKQAVITCPIDAGANAKIVMTQTSYAALAIAKDNDGNYLLARDANGATIPKIENREIIVVEDTDLDANTVIVGDLRTIYHIAYPQLEIRSSAEAGFETNSVKVRAVCRYTDVATYAAAIKVLVSAQGVTDVQTQPGPFS